MSYNEEAASNGQGRAEEPYDIVAFGFGPSNLALAIAADEAAPGLSKLFLEEKSSFGWHPGMLLPGSRMQISFLKDLVTLRNPTSPYTFLEYLKAKGRLERFINLREFCPSRVEFNDYLTWVAAQFANCVRYGSKVRQVRTITGADGVRSLFELQVTETATSTVFTILARNVVYACGGERRLLLGQPESSPRIIHSAQFLDRFPERFPASDAPYVFAVVGDGQSAGELVAYLLEHYPTSKTHLLLSGYAPRPADSSPFVNEAFFARETDTIYAAGDSRRRTVLSTLRNTNYGVMDPDLLERIYRCVYDDDVLGNNRLEIHPFVKLVSAYDMGDSVRLTMCDSEGADTLPLECDGLIMATGYSRSIDPQIFADVLPLLDVNETGCINLSRSYRAKTAADVNCGLYLQGYGETSHGIADTLLSLLPFRSKEIVDDIESALSILKSAPDKRSIAGEYPPKRHLEDDHEKLYAIIERFRFATLISVTKDGEPLTTHVPLTLDRNRGKYGVLFGHMDRSNRHVDWIENREIRAIFHGPNAYISPYILETDQLPTWNSIAVHVRGMARVLDDPTTVISGIAGICERADPAEGAYRLNLVDPRIDRLIDYIVGFEIEVLEMIGRFKLSQDRNPRDRELAARAFTRGLPLEDCSLIWDIHGLESELTEVGLT
jgi:L-ornithine N5-oxygenase